MIVSTSMVTAAEPLETDASVGGENEDDDDYIDCCAPVDNTTKPGKTEDGAGWLYYYIGIEINLKSGC